MRRCLLLLLLLTAQAWAGPVMVLATQGSGTAVVNETTVPLRTGLVLQPADRIELKSGARATLLLIPQGQRQEARGPSVVTVAEAEPTIVGGSLTPVGGPAVALVPTGKNMRHMAGVALRAGARPADTTVRNLRMNGNRLSWEAKNGGTWTADVYAAPDRWWFADANGRPSFQVQRAEDMSKLVTSVKVTGTKARGVWKYSTELKLPQGSYGLYLGDATREMLTTRIWVGDTPQLAETLQEAARWAEREPASAQPWLVRMAAFDDYDRLDEAIQAGREALRRAPKDPGIAEQLARLCLESGRYSQALQYWQRVYRQSPKSTKGAQ